MKNYEYEIKTITGRILKMGASRIFHVVPILFGPSRGLRWRVDSSLISCALGIYEPEISSKLKELLKPGHIFYDVGANVGYYSIMGARLVDKIGIVYAFEPVEKNIDTLKEHISINNFQNIQVISNAITDYDGEGKFKVEHEKSHSHLDSSGIPVVVSKLDTLVGRGFTEPPDFIKMDIEGGELAALQGARETLITYSPIIIVSTHDGSLSSCKEFLENLGYYTMMLNENDFLAKKIKNR